MEIVYRTLNIEDISIELFLPFNRYQNVTQCWRRIDGEWVLQDIPFIEDWDEDEKLFLTACLKNTIETDGTALGAFDNQALVGFASLENEFFGSKNQYLQLSSIHTSYEHRGRGIGKKLFQMICESASDKGAEKLYISAHSAKETQAFYRGMGCVDAVEINRQLAEKEPCDCQLEFSLGSFYNAKP